MHEGINLKKLEQHILSAISSSFFTIFAILFAITSIIQLVKIAAYTSIIKVNFYELLLFYIYALPNILFYTLSVSMFVALTLAFSKISKDYELIIVSSFGLNPLHIIKLISGVIFLFSVSVCILSVALIPKTNYMNALMLETKKKEANFNVSANEFGQKFGKWMIFIENESNGHMSNVKLFNNDLNKKDVFVDAKNAVLGNVNGNLNLMMNDGKAYIFKTNQIDQITFQTMSFNDSLENSSMIQFNNVVDYWSKASYDEKRAKDLAFYILISFLPFVSLLIIFSISVFNPRYEHNYAIFYSLILIVLFYSLTYYLTTKIQLGAIFIIFSFWMLLSLIFYQLKIRNSY